MNIRKINPFVWPVLGGLLGLCSLALPQTRTTPQISAWYRLPTTTPCAAGSLHCNQGWPYVWANLDAPLIAYEDAAKQLHISIDPAALQTGALPFDVGTGIVVTQLDGQRPILNIASSTPNWAAPPAAGACNQAVFGTLRSGDFEYQCVPNDDGASSDLYIWQRRPLAPAQRTW